MMQKLKKRIEELEKKFKNLIQGKYNTENERILSYEISIALKILKEWLKREEEILQIIDNFFSYDEKKYHLAIAKLLKLQTITPEMVVELIEQMRVKIKEDLKKELEK